MKLLGHNNSLRCVLFHDVSDQTSSFTEGLGVTISKKDFEARVRFLARHYTPVALQDILSAADSGRWPRQPVLVTFDDAYASVVENAAPVCRKYGVPAVLFINASCLDNTRLALDNLLCYVANTFGMSAINSVAREMKPFNTSKWDSLRQIFSDFIPALSLTEREAFQDRLIAATGLRVSELAREAGLYLTEQQIRELAASDFEIGDHTYSHVHCRHLSEPNFREEIDRNKAALEMISGRKVRAFSVPYGSSADLTPELTGHLQRSGHEAVFLVESLPNRPPLNLQRLYRVSVHSRSNLDFVAELEVLPYLRTVRNRFFRSPQYHRKVALN